MRDPDTARPAANDSPQTVTRIEPVRDTFTAFVRVPRGTPITIIERDDHGPWWSAIAGAVGLNALAFIVAMIIMS